MATTTPPSFSTTAFNLLLSLFTGILRFIVSPFVWAQQKRGFDLKSWRQRRRLRQLG